jgi:hypothetical protein
MGGSVSTLWDGRAFWAQHIAPPAAEPQSQPGPPNCSIPGVSGVSYCASCTDGLHPKQRCSAVPARVRREMTLPELYAASLCPFDLRDELDRRRFGATRDELEEGERIEQELTEKDDGRGPWVYVSNPLRRWRKKASK